jgi:hypothetical protein
MRRRAVKTRRAPVDKWVVFTTHLSTRSQSAKPEIIMRSESPQRLAAMLTLAAALGLGCAQLPQAPPLAVTSFDSPALAVNTFDALEAGLEAQGPGVVFPSIEAAAVDALTYADLSGQAGRDTELMRGGTIYATGGGYSYGEIHVAKPLNAHRVSYTLKPQDVARFAIYPRDRDRDVNRANERPSMRDRRAVSFIDPLHRPLYILHPSLVIREYRGEGHELAEVANLRRPPRVPGLLAGN